jgi:uncharacterized membrane protein YkoI
MTKFHFIVGLLACVGAVGAHALPQNERRELRTSMQPAVFFQARGISLEQAVAMVQAKYGAKVMRANSVEEDGRVVHYIRLMTPDRSRVWTVRVDAMSGREY